MANDHKWWLTVCTGCGMESAYNIGTPVSRLDCDTFVAPLRCLCGKELEEADFDRKDYLLANRCGEVE